MRHGQLAAVLVVLLLLVPLANNRLQTAAHLLRFAGAQEGRRECCGEAGRGAGWVHEPSGVLRLRGGGDGGRRVMEAGAVEERALDHRQIEWPSSSEVMK